MYTSCQQGLERLANMTKEELRKSCEEKIIKYYSLGIYKNMLEHKAVLDLLDENESLSRKLLNFQQLLMVCVSKLRESNINSSFFINAKDLQKIKHKCLSIEVLPTGDVELKVLNERGYQL